MKLLTDPTFRYTPVAKQGEGYLKKKFDRIRAEMARNEKLKPAIPIRRAEGKR